jgi:hypothetical protein
VSFGPFRWVTFGCCLDWLGFCKGFLGWGGDFTHKLLFLVALRSFSRAVPYLASLVGHLLASAGLLCSVLVFFTQFAHQMLCRHGPFPPDIVSSPFRLAAIQSVEFGSVCSDSEWGPPHIQHFSWSLHF